MSIEDPKTYFEALQSKVGASKYDKEEAEAVTDVVDKLAAHPGVTGRPGLILGRVQSGKTKCFIGVIAKSFDKGVDVAVVLTKGTKTLVNQTESRLQRSFKGNPSDLPVLTFDAIKTTSLTSRETSGKVILIAKKEVTNLNRVIALMQGDLKGRKILVIDDEADFASIGWRKTKKQPLKQASIPDLIDEIRTAAPDVQFLQVTATPFSLYLQPDDYPASPAGAKVLAKKPAFTRVLNPHSAYVGGDEYFGDFDEKDYRSYLFVPVDQPEQDRLRKKDEALLEIDLLTAPEIDGLRRAVVTFLVGGSIRHLQNPAPSGRELQFSMLIHNDVANDAQEWQRELVESLLNALRSAATSAEPAMQSLVDEAIADLSQSIAAGGGSMPLVSDIKKKVKANLSSGRYDLVVVNSTNKDQLLDEDTGALKMRAEFNIYLGGNMLDRGITVPSMISFYYGRRPNMMQADTVLQHFRMFGARPKDDVLATRLFTAPGIHERMKAIHDLDSGLRQAFRDGVNDHGVAFLKGTKKSGIRFCAPNKIKLTQARTVSPGRTLSPTNIKIRAASVVKPATAQIDAMIDPSWTNKFETIDRARAFQIIDMASQTMDFEGAPFDWGAMKALITYYLEIDKAPKLLVTVSKERDLDWKATRGKTGLSIMGETLRRKVDATSGNSPVLVLLQQNGTKEGWSGTPFWWPVLYASQAASPCVYAASTAVES